MYANRYICVLVCVSVQVYSPGTVPQTGQSFSLNLQDRQTAYIPYSGTSPVEADCLDQAQTEQKKKSNKSMFGNQN